VILVSNSSEGSGHNLKRKINVCLENNRKSSNTKNAVKLKHKCKNFDHFLCQVWVHNITVASTFMTFVCSKKKIHHASDLDLFTHFVIQIMKKIGIFRHITFWFCHPAWLFINYLFLCWMGWGTLTFCCKINVKEKEIMRIKMSGVLPIAPHIHIVIVVFVHVCHVLWLKTNYEMHKCQITCLISTCVLQHSDYFVQFGLETKELH
jgi:hypothetical protein